MLYGSFFLSSWLCGALLVQPQRTQVPERSRPRVEVGANFNIGIYHVGFHVQAHWAFARWRLGELTAGPLFATHFYLPLGNFPGSAYEVSDTTIRGSGVFGHTFWLARRRFRISTNVFMGVSARVMRSSIHNTTYDIRAEHRDAAAFFEAGVSGAFGVRLGQRWGVHLDWLVPLFVAQQAHFLDQWFVSSPYIGLSGSYQF